MTLQGWLDDSIDLNDSKDLFMLSIDYYFVIKYGGSNRFGAALMVSNPKGANIAIRDLPYNYTYKEAKLAIIKEYKQLLQNQLDILKNIEL